MADPVEAAGSVELTRRPEGRSSRGLTEPPLPEVVPVEREPLQRDDRHAVVDPAVRHSPHRLVEADRVDEYVLVLLRIAEDPVYAGGIDPAAIDRDEFRAAAGRGKEVADVHEIADVAADLFPCFPARDRFGVFALVDHAGDDLDDPRVESGCHRTDAELLHDNDGVVVRVVGEDGDGAAAVEVLARYDPAPPAAVQAMPQPVAVEAIEPLISRLPVEDFDVILVHGDASCAGRDRAGPGRGSSDP